MWPRFPGPRRMDEAKVLRALRRLVYADKRLTVG